MKLNELENLHYHVSNFIKEAVIKYYHLIYSMYKKQVHDIFLLTIQVKPYTITATLSEEFLWITKKTLLSVFTITFVRYLFLTCPTALV